MDGPIHAEPIFHGHSDIDKNVLRPQLEELWDVKRDGEDEDGEDVTDDPDPTFPTVDAVVILHRGRNSEISKK